MALIPSLLPWLQPLIRQMTAPTAASFLSLAAGWLLARRHTVTGAIVAAGALGKKHHSAYHRVFAAAVWSLDAVGLAFLALILASQCLARLFGGGAVVYLVIDDTLYRRRGRHLFGIGSHYDPLLTGRKASNANRSLKSRGHCWVILGVLVSFPFRPEHCYCLPLLFRLYLNRKSAKKEHCPYRSRPELARQMLLLACQAWPARQFHLLTDSAYGGQEMLRHLPGNCGLTARWITNAVLHEPAPTHAGAGRRRLRGPRLPNARQMLDERCQHATFDSFGVRGAYRWSSRLACLRTVPGRRLRIIATEPLSEGGHPLRKHRAMFYSTDVLCPPLQILEHFGGRWSIEMTIHDCKQQLGAGQPQSWSKAGVQRATPTLMLLYNVVLLWFAAEGWRHWRPSCWPWYAGKQHPSFADMLGTLRGRILRHRLRHVLSTRCFAPGPQKVLQVALRLIKQAA